MSLVKITFDSSSVSSKQDADCNHHLAGGVNGILDGVLGRCQASVSNSYIQFQSGYVQVYGRRVFVESGTKISVSLDSAAKGYVCVKYDLTNSSATLIKKEASGSFPSLTQNDLMNGGLIYEFPLARYTKTTSSITLDSGWAPPYIEKSLPIAKQALLAANGTRFSVVDRWAYLFDPETYEAVTDVRIDLDGIVDSDSVVLVVFESVDTEGYGGQTQIYGSFALLWSQLIYSKFKGKIIGYNNSEIIVTVDNDQWEFDKILRINVPNVSGRPNVVHASVVKAVCGS